MRNLTFIAFFFASTNAMAAPDNADQIQARLQEKVSERLQQNASEEDRARFASATPEQQAAYTERLRARAMERAQSILRSRHAARSG
jgi:hypothetical protein